MHHCEMQFTELGFSSTDKYLLNPNICLWTAHGTFLKLRKHLKFWKRVAHTKCTSWIWKPLSPPIVFCWKEIHWIRRLTRCESLTGKRTRRYYKTDIFLSTNQYTEYIPFPHTIRMVWYNSEIYLYHGSIDCLQICVHSF